MAISCRRAALRAGVSEAVGVGLAQQPRSEWCEPSGMLMATSVDEPDTLVVTDCDDHGSSIPLEKTTRDVARSNPSMPPDMPIEAGSQPGLGVTPKSRRQLAARPASDHGCGGNMSDLLLAPIGWTTSVHAR